MRRALRQNPILRALPLLLAALVLLPTAGWSARGKKKKAAVIEGKVIDQVGAVIQGVAVAIGPTTGDEQVATAESNKKGAFTLEIPGASGSYTIRLSKKGYSPYEVKLDLEGGAKQGLEFRLVDESAGKKREAALVYNAGADAFGEGDLSTAKEKFKQALELDPSLAEPYLGLADILLREGDSAGALAAAESYLGLKPGDIQAQRIVAEAAEALGDTAKAQSALESLGDEGISKNLGIRAYNEGVLALQGGDEDGAVAKFRRALELNSDLLEPRAGLATILYNRESYDEALKLTEEMLEIDPDSVQGRRVRYLVHDARGDAEAAAAFDAYQEVDGAAASSLLFQRAELDFRNGATASAKSALLKVVASQPDMARAHYTLGLVYASEDNKAKAKEHLERFMALDPNDPEVAAAKEMLTYF